MKKIYRLDKSKAMKLTEQYVYHSQLTNEQQKAYKCVAMDGHTFGEAESILGKPRKTINTHCNRASEKIKQAQKMVAFVINQL